MPVGRRDLHEMLQLCMGSLFLSQQDGGQLMYLVEAIETRYSLVDRGSMCQYWGAQGGSPSAVCSLWPS